MNQARVPGVRRTRFKPEKSARLCDYRIERVPRWEDETGKQVPRLATKSRTAGEMTGLGYRMVGKFGKHKFAKIFDNGLTQSLIRMGDAIRGARVAA